MNLQFVQFDVDLNIKSCNLKLEERKLITFSDSIYPLISSTEYVLAYTTKNISVYDNF